jgi:energy-coupling factor transport system substrate-specific component
VSGPGGIGATTSRQVFNFLWAGGAAAAVNWVVRFPLAIYLPLGWSVFVAYLIGMAVGYQLYRIYVFPGSRASFHQVLVFLGVNAAGAVVVLAATYALLALLPAGGLPEYMREGLAHGVAIALGAVSNFLGHKLLTFRAATHGEAGLGEPISEGS